MESKLLRPLTQAVALALAAGGAHAATITVTDSGDAGTNSTCTLRQAIVSANIDSASGSTCTAGNGTDTIVFAPGLANSTITLADGELDITSSLTLSGSGQTIAAESNYRVMAVLDNGNTVTTVNLTGLTLTNGYCASAAGGGLSIGDAGGCSQQVESKPSPHSHRDAIPAALPTGPNVTLSQVTISGNSSGNEAAGLYIGNATVAINQSTVSGNTLNASGNYGAGGIYITQGSSVTISDSTISGNSVSGKYSYLSGGIYVWDSAVTITNSTISGNMVASGNYSAGGMSISNGSAGVYDSTITGNTTTTANAAAGGILVGADESAILTLTNTILSGNTGTQADLGVYSSNVIAQFNLMGSELSSTYAGNGNVFNDNPGLGALVNNGGPTLTMMPQPSSPALGAGNIGLIPAGVTTDQRGTGYARVINGSLDVGSIETGVPAAVTVTPTPALSRWAMLALGGLLALFGLRKRRRAD